MNDFKDYSGCSKICREFEKLRLESYQDSAKVWTIGYGTTRYPDGKAVGPNEKCTEQQAEAWLQDDLRGFAKDVKRLVLKELRQCQWEALIVLVYNIGPGAFGRSTLLKTINVDPDSLEIVENWTRFIKSGGKQLRGLMRRRLFEVYHYFTW